MALTQQRDASVEMKELYKLRRDVVCTALEKADNLPLLIPQAAMYVMADIRAYGLSGYDFCHALYKETGVSVLDAGAFGESARGWIRISFTLGEDTLKEGCRRIVEFLNTL